MSQHSSRGPAWEAVRKACLERDGYVCHMCGGPADTADHIIPASMGGKDLLENLLAACRSCNGRRQDKLLVRISFVNPRWLDGQV